MEIVNSFQEHLKELIFSVLFALITLRIAWKRGLFSLPKDKISDHSPSLYFSELLTAFIIFLGIALFFPPLLFLFGNFLKTGSWILAPALLDAQTQAWLNVATISSYACGIGLFCKLSTARLQWAVWRKNAYAGSKRCLEDCILGSVTWLVVFPLVLVIDQFSSLLILELFDKQPIDQVAVKYLKMTLGDPLLFLCFSFLIVLVVPAIEEMLFRGFLQTWLKQKLGRSKAIALASFVFACFHISPEQGLYNIQFFSALFLLSCFLGFVYERQQSLWASIALHATFNGISALVIFLN